MSVSSVTEVWPDQNSERGADSRGAVRQFLVFFSAAGDSPVKAELAAGIPRVGQAHPSDLARKVATVTPKLLGPSVAQVTVRYEGRSLLDDDGNETTSPLDAPPRIAVSWISEDVRVDVDQAGNPIVNVLGEPVEGLTEPKYMRQLTITRNLADFDMAAYGGYEGSVNGDAFLDGPPGTVRCSGLAASKQYSPGLSYWEVSGTFTFRLWTDPLTGAMIGWQRRVLNQGFIKRKKDSGGAPVMDTETNRWKTVEIREADGQPCRRPKLLDANGDLLKKGAQPHYLLFTTKPSATFATLNLLKA